ncbi:hypothetical protein D9V86_07285 [Bacteroidetes/Chlorobi group bacterium ChocPot_Mid]|nr:MAG: hypothetical protein D9V86_07285 [Bacteroidetes/Chlorobi group bacterium ChocPot_Mid]
MEDNIILKLGHGAFLRRKQTIGEGPVELLNPDKTIENVEWEVYHKFRNHGYGECIAFPSKYSDSTGIYDGIPGHDNYYYFGLSDKGKEMFYLLQKGKK